MLEFIKNYNDVFLISYKDQESTDWAANRKESFQAWVNTIWESNISSFLKMILKIILANRSCYFTFMTRTIFYPYSPHPQWLGTE